MRLENPYSRAPAPSQIAAGGLDRRSEKRKSPITRGTITGTRSALGLR